ncbi:3867_t:CDS:2, partial [Acaulospora colombiana]
MANDASPSTPQKYEANHRWLRLAGSGLFVSFFCVTKELDRPPGYGEVMNTRTHRTYQHTPSLPLELINLVGRYLQWSLVTQKPSNIG